MQQDYAALIIDIKKSRTYSKENRNNIQHYIVQIMKLLNNLYSNELVRDVDFSAGDEVQGLFVSPEAAYLYYRMLSMWLHPVEVRAGIGVGNWDVQLVNKGTTGQDGPVYHRARYAIKNADANEGYPALLFSNRYSDNTINAIIGGAASIMAKQSVYQNQVMLITELLFPVCNQYIKMYDHNITLEINQLLHTKSKIAREIDKTIRTLPFEHLNHDCILSIHFDKVEEGCESSNFFITGGKRRGIPTKLASIIGISRQMIDKTIKAGNIYIARNMSITAVNEMKNIR